MQKIVSLLIVVMAIATLAPIATAQDNSCNAYIEEALSFTDSVCADTTRNQACYGNVTLDVVPQDDGATFTFAAPGDVMDVALIESLQLSPLTNPDEWGVALMKLQANLPDSVPGQAVTFLLFGDVSISNQVAGDGGSTLNGTISSNANLRGGDGTGFAVVGSATAGEAVIVDGRNDAGDWVRIQRDDETSAWIFAELITLDGDVQTLAAISVDADAASGLRPMQAFYFRTGIATTECLQAPPDAILVQTPDGTDTAVTFNANGVDIALGSTALLQSVPSQFMTVTLIEGSAIVTALDTSVTVQAGAQARIPVDAQGLASGAPELVTYEETLTANLPVRLLPRTITAAAPLLEDELSALPTVAAGVADWSIVSSSVERICTTIADMGTPSFAETIRAGWEADKFYDNGLDAITTFDIAADGSSLSIVDTDVVYAQLADGSYEYSYTFEANAPGVPIDAIISSTGTRTDTLSVVSDGVFTGTIVIATSSTIYDGMQIDCTETLFVDATRQ